MKAILIAEKPSLMREIQGVYNKHRNELGGLEIDFLAQAGHLVGLKMPKEVDEEKYGKWSMDHMPEIYPYQYKVISGKHDLINKIKTAVKSGDYDFVIHAGDPDGEGELLVRLVLDYVGNKLPVKRFWSNDLTEGAILSALKNLRNDSELDTVYDAALVRQHADYQFGMNVTGIASLKMRDLCRLGRVKAPIIYMIVERELAIRNFVEKTTYKPIFTYQGCEFVADKVFDEKKDAEAFNPKTDRAQVTECKREKKSKKAPKLFKLSTLQTEAYKELKMSAAETLATLQLLYEAKVTSYPRTDCEYISSAVDIGTIGKSVVKEIGVDPSLLIRDPKEVLADKTYANDKAISTEGHTAVIPTGKRLSSSASDKEKKLYELICRRFLAMFAGEKVTLSTKVVAVPNNCTQQYVFTESEDVDAGYELVLNPNYKMKKGKGVSFAQGTTISPIVFSVKEVVSKPPARYNEGSLIAALDMPEAFEGEDGKKIKFKIGTQATRANIIEECQKNGYFTKKSGVFYATPKSEAVIASFPNVALFNPEESGRWEEIFDNIRNGSVSAKEAEDSLIKAMIDISNEMKEAATKVIPKGATEELGKCPKCGASISKGKFGAYCTGKCGMSIGKYMGKTLTDSQIKSLLAGKKTLIKGLTSKAGKSYDAYITPESVEPFSYTKKDGSTASGFQWKFVTEFPKTGKK